MSDPTRLADPTFAKTLRRDKNYDVTCLRHTAAWQARRRDMGFRLCTLRRDKTTCRRKQISVFLFS